MNNSRFWYDRCILQRGSEVDYFISSYLQSPHRHVLLIAGAGFDPRATVVAERLVGGGCEIRCVLIQEERADTNAICTERALLNLKVMRKLIPSCLVSRIAIFAVDGAVVGGRKAAQVANGISLDGITDVVIDFSAMSKGVAFPIARLLLARLEMDAPDVNLHLMVTDEVETDVRIKPVNSDKIGPVHGFQGNLSSSVSSGKEIIWLPQLSVEQKEALTIIYRYVKSPGVCPILPFPAQDPRIGDMLASDFGREFQSIWHIDPRDILYASEGNPLDLYRSILRLDADRQRTFSAVGGSLTVLSPVGSKVTSIGAFMAAVDKDFPVIYIEALSYDVEFGSLDAERTSSGDIVHVWLHGEAYAGIYRK